MRRQPAIAVQRRLGRCSDPLTDAVFDLLDTDKDGKLSKEELEAAETVLMKLRRRRRRAGRRRRSWAWPATAASAAVDQAAAVPPAATSSRRSRANLMLIPRERPASGRPARLHGRPRADRRSYDKDKDGKLSREEIGFPKELFATLDRNKDGKLDALELARWLTGKPAGEFTVAAGATSGGDDARAGRRGRAAAGEAATSDERQPGAACASTSCRRRRPVGGRASDSFILQQFQQVDEDKKGFVTRKQVEARPAGASMLAACSTWPTATATAS